MKARRIGVPTLAARMKTYHPREMEIPWKTLQRFLAGIRTHDMALTICKAFVEKLPNKPMPFQALGLALYAIYNHPLPLDIAGNYDLIYEGAFSSSLSISTPSDACALVTERNADRHILDGVIVATSGNTHLVALRDRLMLTPRYIMLQDDTAHIYEFSPIKHLRDNPLVFDAKFSRHA